MIYCLKCGNTIKDNDMFCRKCGAKRNCNCEAFVVEDVKAEDDSGNGNGIVERCKRFVLNCFLRRNKK